ncbi:MAG: flagellar motor protein MotB [Bryobacteraceae bacterium]
MIRKKHAPEHENHERWLVSYADFITLLFAFFVVMFASSQTDKGRAQQVSDSVKKALESGSMSAAMAVVLGGAPGDKEKGNSQMHGPGGQQHLTADERKAEKLAELLPSLNVLTTELKSEIETGQVQVSMEARGLVVSFKQAALFPSGEDAISADALPSLDKVAVAIIKLPNPVRLEGHTDSKPINTKRFRSNWDLSAARSIALLEILTTQFNVPRSHVSVAGYADNAPVASNETEEGRARNRRVDIVILNDQGVLGEPAKPADTKATETKTTETQR